MKLIFNLIEQNDLITTAEQLSMPSNSDVSIFHDIDNDSILRAFIKDEKDTSYSHLTYHQLVNFINTYYNNLSSEKIHRLKQAWRDTDGFQMSPEQMLYLFKNLLPSPFKLSNLKKIDQRKPFKSSSIKYHTTRGNAPSTGKVDCSQYKCHRSSDCLIVGCGMCFHYDPASNVGRCGDSG